MKKRKQKETAPSIPIPKEVLLPGVECFLGNVGKRRWSGKLGEDPISYSLSLPALPCPETCSYLESLRDAFLSFLAQESKKEREEVWFGGMDWYFENRSLHLLFAFCPFRDRKYEKEASLLLSEDGRIEKIERKKKHTRN